MLWREMASRYRTESVSTDWCSWIFWTYNALHVCQWHLLRLYEVHMSFFTWIEGSTSFRDRDCEYKVSCAIETVENHTRKSNSRGFWNHPFRYRIVISMRYTGKETCNTAANGFSDFSCQKLKNSSPLTILHSALLLCQMEKFKMERKQAWWGLESLQFAIYMFASHTGHTEKGTHTNGSRSSSISSTSAGHFLFELMCKCSNWFGVEHQSDSLCPSKQWHDGLQTFFNTSSHWLLERLFSWLGKQTC